MKKIQNNLVTKDHLDKKIKEFKTELKGELKENLLEIKDEIVGEIKAMREEFDAHQFSHARIEETLENHEGRLSKPDRQ